MTAAFHITQTFEAQPTATETFTPVPTNTPEPTATEEPTATAVPAEDEEELLISRREDQATELPPEPTATAYFPDKADFVAALPSPNQFLPGQRFNLTWQLRNAGTTTWSGKYRFHYSEGIQLADQSSYSISESTDPGGVMTITMPATAPSQPGTYQCTWVLENPDGVPFYWVNYVTIVGDQTFITDVPELNPTETPSSLEWMCSDPDRSNIQGSGCQEYCSQPVVEQMAQSGLDCYAYGERVTYEE